MEMPENVDLDQMQQEFEQNWIEDNEQTDIETQDEVVETPPIEEDEIQEETEEETPQIHEDDAQKRNAAFAELRRKAQENEKYATFIQKLAEQSGTTPEEILQRYEEKRLEEEAEKQQVPIDVLKRIQSLEQENQSVKEQAFATRFNAQVESTIEKYGASEADVQATFQYAAENGIDFRQSNISFEAVHKMAHLDSIVEKQVQQSRQKELEEKKQRQLSSALPSGSSVSQTSDEPSEEDVLKYLKDNGLLR
jgi:hypothetical protein